MGRRGPPSKPTHLKVLEGNPGNQRLPKHEPQPEPDTAGPPEWLDPVAREEWGRLYPSLDQHGLVTVWDRSMFAAYCDAFSKWRKVTEAVNEADSLVMSVGEKGYRQEIPEVSLQIKYFEVVRKCAAVFGFTPANRTGLEVKPPTIETPMARLLKGAK
ncbi:phage terminase small subunit P27 family [Gemmatimonadota bacterium]